MTDERVDAPDPDPDVAATGEEAPDEERVKVKRTLAERAVLDLGRARKALGPDWTKTDERSDFYLAQAEVLALLDLADAIRSSDRAA